MRKTKFPLRKSRLRGYNTYQQTAAPGSTHFVRESGEPPRRLIKMPPHPPCAFLNHVMEASLENAKLALAEQDLEQVALDFSHARCLSEILNSYLLYRDTERFDQELTDRYFSETRPRYMEEAKSEYLSNMSIPWEFLDASSHHLGQPAGLRTQLA